MRISVIGCGYLGATHAACMAELGFEVVGVELDPSRLATLSQGRAPFVEPGLDDVLRRHVESGKLQFTDSTKHAATTCDVHFICVGTPQQRNSLAADVSYVMAAVEALAPHLSPGALVVGKSTVPVGTAAWCAARLAELAPAGTQPDLAWNPEFLREGHAVEDTLHPDRLVLGVSSSEAESRLRQVFARPIAEGSPVIVTDYATAELVKVSANAFLATKISFINAIADLCELVDGDVVQLADALGHDARIGRKFLNAGVGFGGGCLPKDIRAFQHRAGELGADDILKILAEVDHINLQRRKRVVAMVNDLVGDVPEARVAILGAAFKPESDDVRDSPALHVAGQLHLAGANVAVYDPAAAENARRIFPTLTYATSTLEACTGADVVVLLTEWQEFQALRPTDLDGLVQHRRLVDGRNVLDPAEWRAAGWEFRGIGRR